MKTTPDRWTITMKQNLRFNERMPPAQCKLDQIRYGQPSAIIY